jgi:hypothetical protein
LNAYVLDGFFSHIKLIECIRVQWEVVVRKGESEVFDVSGWLMVLFTEFRIGEMNFALAMFSVR